MCDGEGRGSLVLTVDMAGLNLKEETPATLTRLSHKSPPNQHPCPGYLMQMTIQT